MMQPQGAPAMPMPGQSPAQEAAEGPEGPNTITINMTPGAITVTTAQGTKQCESIGECLQTVLEAYEASAGKEGESDFEGGYAGDSAQEARPINGMPVK